MLRVCGASGQRDPLSASRCWCRGFFCGRGGGRHTSEFRRDFPRSGAVLNYAAFELAIGQLDLFDVDARAAKWRERLRNMQPRAAAKPARAKGKAVQV